MLVQKLLLEHLMASVATAVPVTNTSLCQEAHGLVKEWALSAEVYAGHLGVIAERMSTLSCEAFEKILQNASRAWDQCEHAREALEMHRAKHGC
jgi:hypothetical protein